METSCGDCRCSFHMKNKFSKKAFFVFLFRGVMKHRVEIIVVVFLRKKKKCSAKKALSKVRFKPEVNSAFIWCRNRTRFSEAGVTNE